MIERDPDLCANPNCAEEATTATPEGAMCSKCAALLARSHEENHEGTHEK